MLFSVPVHCTRYAVQDKIETSMIYCCIDCVNKSSQYFQLSPRVLYSVVLMIWYLVYHTCLLITHSPIHHTPYKNIHVWIFFYLLALKVCTMYSVQCTKYTWRSSLSLFGSECIKNKRQRQFSANTKIAWCTVFSI